jgi:aspartate aminotransferase
MTYRPMPVRKLINWNGPSEVNMKLSVASEAGERISISKRGMAVPPSPIRKLIPLADQAKKRGIKIYHLNIGQPDLDKLSKYYQRRGLDIKPDEIIVTTGGSEAIIFAMTIISEPGDEIIVFEPFYTNYNGFAVQAGIKLVPITTHAEDGFHIPSDEVIQKAISPRTRGILYCNPNNPTGTVYTAPELERLKSLAVKYNLFLMADEVYREFIYEGNHISIMSLNGIDDRAIMLDSISKRFSACGARVGNLVTRNRDVYRAGLYLGQARLCSPTLEQVGANAAYDLGDEYFKQVADEYRLRRDTVYKGLMKIPGTVCLNPGGAFYIMAKLPIDDAEKFAAFLLTDFNHEGKTVMVAPGPGFYASPGRGQNECRIAYVLKTDDLNDAMDLLRRGVEAYNAGK